MIQDPAEIPNLLQRAVDLLCLCLETNTSNGAPEFCGLYHGTRPADCCDFMIAHVERFGTTDAASFPGESARPLKCETVPSMNVVIQLLRPCWPVLKDDAHNPFPLNADTSLASANLLMDAVAVQCCLTSDLSDLTDSFIMGDTQLSAKMGATTPIPPRGGCAGWNFRFSIMLDACCDGRFLT